MQNKPNLPAVGNPITPKFRYSSDPIRYRLCETKPIREESEQRQVLYGKSIRINGASARSRQNKANSRVGAWGRSRGVSPSALALVASGLARACCVQTRPMCRRRTGQTIAKARGLDAATRHVRQARQTNPICPPRPQGPPTGSTSAKQSQFPPSSGQDSQYSTVPLFQHSNPMPVVQNKANFCDAVPIGRSAFPGVRRAGHTRLAKAPVSA